MENHEPEVTKSIPNRPDTSKHFQVLQPKDEYDLRPGFTLVLCGHGWHSEPGKQTYMHVFEIYNTDGNRISSALELPQLVHAHMIEDGVLMPLD